MLAQGSVRLLKHSQENTLSNFWAVEEPPQMEFNLVKDERRGSKGKAGEEKEKWARSLFSIKCPVTLRTLEPMILEVSQKGIQGKGK